MILTEAIDTIFNAEPSVEIVIANQEEYFRGTPQYSKVCDIVKENGKLVILTK